MNIDAVTEKTALGKKRVEERSALLLFLGDRIITMPRRQFVK